MLERNVSHGPFLADIADQLTNPISPRRSGFWRNMNLLGTGLLAYRSLILPVDRATHPAHVAVVMASKGVVVVAVAGVVGVEGTDQEKVLPKIERSKTNTNRARPITTERGGMIKRWPSLALAQLDSLYDWML